MSQSASARSPRTSDSLGTQRWSRVLPVALVTYSLAYLDRSNYSIGVAGGMKSDLGISGGMAAWLGASFFLGYFLFQVPGVIYAQRRSIRNLIFWSLLAWGLLASAQGVISSVTVLLAVRFLIGVVEAAVLPAMVILLANWFTKRERGRANTVLILGNPVTVLWMTALSGYLVDLTSWRGMFIIEGLPAIAWAFVFRVVFRDHPREAGWLDAAERDAVEQAIAEEQRLLTPVAGYLAAFRSRNVVLLCVQYLLWSLGVYGFLFWLPSIVKAGSGQGIGMTGLLSAIPYLLAIVLMVVNSRASDRNQRRPGYVWPWLLVGAAGFYGSYLLGPQRFWLSFSLLVVAGAAMYAPYGPYFALITEFLPGNVAGASVALINSAGALGGFAGSYLVGWLDAGTGSPTASFLLMAVSLALAAALIPLVRVGASRPASEPSTHPLSPILRKST